MIFALVAAHAEEPKESYQTFSEERISFLGNRRGAGDIFRIEGRAAICDSFCSSVPTPPEEHLKRSYVK